MPFEAPVTMAKGRRAGETVMARSGANIGA
jgi:hypothetical protein